MSCANEALAQDYRLLLPKQNICDVHLVARQESRCRREEILACVERNGTELSQASTFL